MNAKDSSHTRPTPRAGRKWLVYGIVGLLSILVLLVALLPAALSTSAGRGLLVNAINDGLKGSVTLDGLALSWFGGQHIRGATLLDPRGEPIIRLEEFSTELTLVQAFTGKLSLGRTLVRGLNVDLNVDQSGDNNLSQAVASDSPTEEDTPLLIPFTGNIELADIHITVTAPDTEPVMFDGLAGILRIDPAERVLNVDLHGNSRQGKNTGAFTITGQVMGLIAPDGVLTPQAADGVLEADVKDLPMDGVDGLLGLGGLLSAAAGDHANLTLRASGTAATQNLTAAVDAPRIKADIAARIDQGRLTLSQPASVRMDITPELFAQITRPAEGGAPLILRQAFPLKLNIAQLGLSVADFNPGAVALRGGIEAEKTIQLSAVGELGDVSINNLTASADSERLAEALNIAMTADVTARGAPGNLKIQGTLSRLFNAAGALQPDKLLADVDVGLSNLPTALVDQLSGQNGQLVALLGARMNLNAALKSSGPERIDGALSIDAGPLQTKDVAFTLTDVIALSKPAEIRYRLSPESVKRLLGDDGPGLLQPVELMLRVDEFSAPRPEAGAPVFAPARTRVQGALTSEPLLLSGIPDVGTLHISQGRVDLSGDSLAAIQLSGTMKINDPKGGLLADLDASPLEITLDTTTGIQDDGQLKTIAGRLRFTSAGLNGDLKTRVAPDFSRATLTEPAALQWVVTPGLLKAFGVMASDQAALGKPAPVRIELSRLDLPLDGFQPSSLQAAGALHMDELVLTGHKSVSGTALRNVDIVFDFDGAKGAAGLGVSAQTTVPGAQKPGALKLDATLTRLVVDGALNLDTPAVDATVKVDALPVALVEALSSQTGLGAVLGSVIDLQGSMANSGGDKAINTIEIKARSQNLTVDAGFKTDKELVLTRPTTLGLTLTPDAYAALAGPPAATGYRLAENTTIEAVIRKLRWPMDAPGDKFDPSRTGIDATLSAPGVVFRDPATDHRVAIQTLKIDLQGADLAKPFGFELSGQIDGGPGRLTLSGQVADLLAPDGQFSAARASLRMDGQLQQLPVSFLDQMLEMDGLLAATFGNTADVAVSTNLQGMTGPINLQLKSPSASTGVKARLGADGVVLNEPLVAEVKVSENFGKLVLGKIHPIFETTQSAERPVRLEIPAEGVVIPIADFDLTKVVIPRMTLDVGSLTLQSGWLLKGTIGLAQKFGALKSSGRDQWIAQFTPAVLHLRDGKVTYDRRLDLLLDQRLHLATWGTADIANNRADFTLAFMPETLEKVFGLAVAPGDALRIPMRGALDAPSVDFAKAGLELGRLQAQKQLAKKNQLLGAVVGAATQTAAGGGPIPPASVDPLPWGPLPVPEGQATAQDAPEPQPAPAPKSAKEQAIGGLIDLLRKKTE